MFAASPSLASRDFPFGVQMVEAVLRLWDAGLDTDRIATVLKKKQHEVEKYLHKGLEERRNGGKEKSPAD